MRKPWTNDNLSERALSLRYWSWGGVGVGEKELEFLILSIHTC